MALAVQAIRTVSVRPLSVVPLILASATIAVGIGTMEPTGASSTYSVTSVGVKSSPDGVAVDTATNRIYVANEGFGTVSVISGATNTVIATVRVGSLPEGVAVDPATDTIYVADDNDRTVSVIDGATDTVTATVEVGYAPTGVAVDPPTDRIYVTNYASQTVAVINGATNTVIGTVEVGSRPEGVAVNPTTNTIYVVNSNDAATVSVIKGATETVIATVSDPGGTNVAVDRFTNTIYVIHETDGTVSVIDGATNTVTATLRGFRYSSAGITVNPTTDTIYVASKYLPSAVYAIDGATRSVMATVEVGYQPNELAVDPTSDTIYVTDPIGNTVTVLAPGVTGVIQPLAETAKAGHLTLSCTRPTTTEQTAVEVCPLVTLPKATIDGVTQKKSRGMNPVYVNTARGTPTSGWSLSAVMIPTSPSLNPNPACGSVQGFCNGTGGAHAATALRGQIPATDLTLSGYACTPASTNRNPTPPPSSGGTLKSPLGICQAVAGTSGGEFNIGGGDFTLTIPSTVYRGLYYGTVEFTVVGT